MEDSENKNQKMWSSFREWLRVGFIFLCFIVIGGVLKESQKRTEMEKQFFTEVKESLDAQYQKQEQLYSLVSDHFYFQEANIIAENAFKREEAFLMLEPKARIKGELVKLDHEGQKKQLAKMRASHLEMHKIFSHYLNSGYFPPHSSTIFQENAKRSEMRLNHATQELNHGRATEIMMKTLAPAKEVKEELQSEQKSAGGSKPFDQLGKIFNHLRKRDVSDDERQAPVPAPAGEGIIRIPTRAPIQPWSVTVPSLSTGCGGIDMYVGGYSIVSSTDLIEGFLKQNSKKIMKLLGLQIVRPQYENTRTQLQTIAQGINHYAITG